MSNRSSLASTKQWRLFLAALCLAAMFVVPAQAGIVTFDSLGFGLVPNGHAGLNWSQFGSVDATTWTPTPSGILAGMVSPNMVAINGGFTTAEFSRIGTVGVIDFLSVYLTAAWNDNLSIRVQGFLGANQLYDQTVVVSATAPTLFNFNYTGVDRVLFTPTGGTLHPGYQGSGTSLVMDNLNVNVPIPEPATWVMIGLGLAALPFVQRRRTRRS